MEAHDTTQNGIVFTAGIVRFFMVQTSHPRRLMQFQYFHMHASISIIPRAFHLARANIGKAFLIYVFDIKVETEVTKLYVRLDYWRWLKQ